MRFNTFQWGVLHGLAWVFCWASGWAIHNNVLFGVGLFFLFYSMWRMTLTAKSDNEQAVGWRKRKIIFSEKSVDSFNEWEHSHHPNQFWIERRAYLAGFEAGLRSGQFKKEPNE
jgi:hypothetical protein